MSEPDSTAHDPSEGPQTEAVLITERDIVFNCPHCGGELVVDKDGAGMTFECSHCEGEVVVPPYIGPSPALRAQNAAPPPPPEQVAAPGPSTPAMASAEMKNTPVTPIKSAQEVEASFDFSGEDPEKLRERARHLLLQHKENASQRTEMRGHINRAQIELHRMQLKLQRLVDRQAEIEGELTAMKKVLKKENTEEKPS